MQIDLLVWKLIYLYLCISEIMKMSIIGVT